MPLPPHHPALDPLAAAGALLGRGDRPPLYGSPEWEQLSSTDPRKWAGLLLAAECWRRFWHPDMAALRADWFDWDQRRRFRDTANTISAVMPTTLGPSYAELERRRRLVSRVPCGVPNCAQVVELVHPLADKYAARLPDTSWARCDIHVCATDVGRAA
ncbi:hypothetical protein GCM10012275_02610 [Longimycelium tulufanense]|uniref:Uncharacterized protein n=1 Tax=Longimycelium tulufanense TaxID=907463 RepID=A0A8J3C9N1_9PSEU|nr:DUF2742 domain-containing protein [Longimycelium tulufanense]GGM34849.1 hypothetical protein GCM10012275_02610 [Longimycelium tulufanense]